MFLMSPTLQSSLCRSETRWDALRASPAPLTPAPALTPSTAASHPLYLACDPLPPGKLPASVNRIFVWVFPVAPGLIFHRVGTTQSFWLPQPLSAGCRDPGRVPCALLGSQIPFPSHWMDRRLDGLVRSMGLVWVWIESHSC